MSAFGWVRKPTDQPLNAISSFIVLLVAFNALVFTVPFRLADAFPTGPFGTDTRVEITAFIVQLGILFAGAVALRVVPARWVKPLMIVEGLAVLIAYGPVFAAVSLVALVVWFYAFRVPIPVKHRWIVPALLMIGTGILGATKIIKGPFAFSMFFTLRLLFYTWDQHQNEYPKKSIVDFFVYFFTAPLLFFYPYMLFIPAPARYVEKLQPRLTERRARSVLFHFALGLVLCAVCFALANGFMPFSPNPIVNVLLRYVVGIVFVGRTAHIVYALLLLHGVDCRPPLDSPLLATDFGEMWNRYQIHQKDIQVAMFYSPAIIKLRKMNRYAAMTLAVLWTMFVGNLAIHIFARYMYTPGRWLPMIESRCIFFAVGGAVLAGTLCIQEWRRRKKKPIPKNALGKVYIVACWAATQLFTAALMALP